MFRVVLGRIFGHKWEKAAGKLGKMCNEYLTELYLPFSKYYWGYKLTILGLVHTSGWNRNGFFTAGMKRSVLNASEPTDGCFTAAFFQTQHA
jgi:hypothetical protein